MVVTQAANQWLQTIMAEGSGLINRSLTICHYTSFWGISRANCNGCRFTGSEIADLLRLFAENGLEAQTVLAVGKSVKDEWGDGEL
jgi:hypothetical protein